MCSVWDGHMSMAVHAYVCMGGLWVSFPVALNFIF